MALHVPVYHASSSPVPAFEPLVRSLPLTDFPPRLAPSPIAVSRLPIQRLDVQAFLAYVMRPRRRNGHEHATRGRHAKVDPARATHCTGSFPSFIEYQSLRMLSLAQQGDILVEQGRCVLSALCEALRAGHANRAASGSLSGRTHETADRTSL